MHPPKFTKRLEVMVQPHEYKMLQQCAEHLHRTPSATVRHSIYALHQHIAQSLPRCADGTKCPYTTPPNCAAPTPNPTPNPAKARKP